MTVKFRFSILYLVLGAILLICGILLDRLLTEIIGLSTIYYGLSLNRIEKIEGKINDGDSEI